MPPRRHLAKAQIAAIVAEVRQMDPPSPLYPASLLRDCGHWERVELHKPEAQRYSHAALCGGCRHIRGGAIEIHTGKGRGSRRRVPASSRVLAVLEMRRAKAVSD